MDGIKDEPPASEDKDDGRGAWNTVQLGILWTCALNKYDKI